MRRSNASDMSAWLAVIALAFLLGFLAVFCWIVVATVAAKPACDVDPQPRVSTEPLRYIRTKVTIEDGSGGRLVLVDEGGEWTSGEVQPGPRTTWVEWKNIILGEGIYEVALRTRGGCSARGRVEVH